MLVDKRIYLASQSPRRRELLKQIGVAFDVLPLRAVTGFPAWAPTRLWSSMAIFWASRPDG